MTEQPAYIMMLPFMINIKGNNSKELYFSNFTRHFVIKAKKENPNLKISLSGKDANTREFIMQDNIHPINGKGFESIRFENKDEIDITLVLEK